MIRVSTIRFFTVVAPVPVYLRLALAAAAGLGAWMVWLNPRDVDSALGSILLLQMFAVSTGYASMARRGWFDALLVSGRRRASHGYANLAASALPGVAVWLVVAAVEAICRGGQWPAALSTQRVAALAIVTTGAWAGGLMLPRNASAALWIAALLVLASSRSFLPQLPELQTAPHGLQQLATRALACTLCPFLLLGDTVVARDPGVIGAVLSAAGACASAGSTWLSRREWPLACEK